MIPAAHLLHNMSCPPRTSVVVSQRPVAARHFQFSLSAAIPHLKLRHALRKGHRRIFDARCREIPTEAEVDAAVERLPGFLIGTPAGNARLRIVAVRDAALVIALLSRCIDGLFIKARTPDYSLPALMPGSFLVEDWRDPLTTTEELP